MKINLKKFLTIFLIIHNNINSKPKQVILLRHSEKFIETKESDQEQYMKLTKKGIDRANALANFFGNKTLPSILKGNIDAIFAVTPRTLETIAPTARILQKPIFSFFSVDSNNTKKANKLITDEIMSDKYNDKIILICWTRGNIPTVANLLGLKDASKWPKDVYNRFWILNYNDNETIEFQDIPQKLLADD